MVRVAVFLLLAHVAAARLMTPTLKALVHTNASSVAKAPQAKQQLSEEEQLKNLQAGLASIQHLKNSFATELAPAGDNSVANNFAEGALSVELSKKDSAVWGAIESMLGATAKVMSEVKGKNKDEKAKLMKSLESDLDQKATTLTAVTNKTQKVQQHQNAVYVLGLLNQHREWSMEHQLNATRTFSKDCTVVQQLLNTYDKKKPLAGQLAALMDANETPTTLSKKAAHLFIQLASSFSTRASDCPFCVAQCVGKCHDSGKPYTSCLTECADAGK